MTMLKKKDGTCGYGVGLESGMFPVEAIQTGYMNMCVCAIYDGKEYGIGFGPAFEAPEVITKRALQGEEHGHMYDIFGKNAKGRDGMIYRLSNERIHRCELEENAVLMALLRVINKELYLKEER